jgi:hypothetical protein
VPYWFDTAEGGFFLTNNPGAAANYTFGGGKLVVDASDVVYDCTFSVLNWNNWQSSDPLPFANIGTTINAGSTTNKVVRTNYGTTDDLFFQAFRPMDYLSQTADSSNDPLVDTSVTKAWFIPIQLVSRRKGVGFALKFRQLAWGPSSGSAFKAYSTTGPVVAAIQSCATTAGNAQGNPYVTNFKI